MLDVVARRFVALSPVVILSIFHPKYVVGLGEGQTV
jgi:hypothetical protein